ncbi:hypothetical protein PZ938_11695 [Luteipulveratus sp. YIM 133132]|uniref:Uncharacterized protein n=1 Tax=Luteipulveratus flavus TaxID=3031728 RepID=A0ABT6C910_9MICO|nr:MULTISPECIES: hypothetical protein [unclassified Luteipulveratus]MDE9366269.1 hypothetical protein [Luteipulveratus sp. YIM 133132]MDF8265358.1 hypothetical protein [Luteipulveratus sp. YIM 133296]
MNGRSWRRRVLVVVAVSGVALLAMRWLVTDPNPLGVLALVAILAGLWWFASDHVRDLEAVDWQPHTMQSARRSASDGRLGVLRWLVHETVDPPTRQGSTAVAAPTALQQSLLAVTAGRLRAAHATTPEEDAADVVRRLLAERDPQLTTYLLSVPAPTPDAATLDHLISRIEAL